MQGKRPADEKKGEEGGGEGDGDAAAAAGEDPEDSTLEEPARIVSTRVRDFKSGREVYLDALDRHDPWLDYVDNVEHAKSFWENPVPLKENQGRGEVEW